MDGARRQTSAEALAREAQGGSVHAFEQLVERFEGPLYNYLCVRTGNASAAEDLTQESFLRAWQRLSYYDPRWRFSTWLYTLAQRLAVSAHRSRGKEPTVRGDEALHDVRAGVDPSAEVEARDEGRALWDLAAKVLREEERSALWLRYAEDLSVDEIARILGRPGVTVRVWLFRGRERLGEALERADLAPPRAAASAPQPLLAREGAGGLS